MIKFPKGRFMVYPNGYKADRYIFRVAMVIILSCLIFVCYIQGFDFNKKISFKCNDPLGCENPFYGEIGEAKDYKYLCTYEWCDQANLQPGFYGEKEPKIFNYFHLVWIFTLLFAFIINHKWHNKDFKLKRVENEEDNYKSIE